RPHIRPGCLRSDLWRPRPRSQAPDQSPRPRLRQARRGVLMEKRVACAENRTRMLADLTSLGWKAFQDLCTAVASEVLNRPVQIFLSTNDGGRDGTFVGHWKSAPLTSKCKSTIQCKFTSKRHTNLSLAHLRQELVNVARLIRL